MSIRLICPKGHQLKIKTRYAGKRGLCPVCKAPIVVPRLPDSILDVLNPEESGLSAMALEIATSANGSAIRSAVEEPLFR